MKKPPLEKAIVKKTLKALRARGGKWDKIHGGQWQQAGLLDIVGCYHGRYTAFEVKRDSAGKPTPLQAAEMERIRTAGGVAVLIHTPEMALAILDRLDERREARRSVRHD